MAVNHCKHFRMEFSATTVLLSALPVESTSCFFRQPHRVQSPPDSPHIAHIISSQSPSSFSHPSLPQSFTLAYNPFVPQILS